MAPLVAPDTESACALVLRTASLEGWRVRIEGAGSWMPRDAPADVVLSTTRLRRLIDVSPMTPDEIKWLNNYHARVRDVVSSALDEPMRTWLEAATKPL
jgi:hypothetical protein